MAGIHLNASFARIFRALLCPDRGIGSAEAKASGSGSARASGTPEGTVPLASTVPLGGTDFSRLPETGIAAMLRAFAEQLATEGVEGCTDTPPKAAGVSGKFLHKGARLMRMELDKLYKHDSRFHDAVEEAASLIPEGGRTAWTPEIREAIWKVFFPEGVGLMEAPEAKIEELRRRRTVSITSLNPNPLENPAAELIFTSNILITLPAEIDTIDGLDYPDSLKEQLRSVAGEPQLYHYDHPIHIGVDTESNEAVYGMRGLDQAIAREKETGRVDAGAKVTVLLSLSVTHEGLHSIAKEYMKGELDRGGPFDHLDIYLFTETECRRIIDEVIAVRLPSAEAGDRQEAEQDADNLRRVFGVDGEYGRHYSFLKAVAAFWQVFIDPSVRATFKIDLDQVFPQRELEQESGESALEHFSSPLWGARGVDERGDSVELGMIAGALVNESDIGTGLFTPDVHLPKTTEPGEDAVFCKRLPMAVSTEAEMMTRYTDSSLDGKTRCIQRFHVTGGTNGILIDHLRRYRPFTPSFIGRAEDQAYILSVLYDGKEDTDSTGGPFLRYVHKPGLIMRHDKEAFAGESIKSAEHGRFVGDLVRTWLYSRYLSILPWDTERCKEEIDPFTGCFASNRPISQIFLRLIIYCGKILTGDTGVEEKEVQGLHSEIGWKQREEEVRRVLELAAEKLFPLFNKKRENFVGREYARQKKAWELYYQVLAKTEAEAEKRPERESSTKAREIVESCRVG
ncbi:MAG: hypothetical protein K9L68_01960 [Spirochaetales bacterium]|nr:hypothetical protein [Spirochaetales bacterium]MCF7937343.1 hypothetical protein [Spirochaetales bacterium]